MLITHLNRLPDHAQVLPIFNRANKPVASAAYVREHKDAFDGRLENTRLLHDASMQAWEDWFAVAGFRPKRFTHGPVFPDFNYLFAAVLAGQGVALCPVEVFGWEIARGDLVVLSDIATCTDESYYIVTTERRPPAVTQFVKWFAKRVSEPLV
ncbi:LysR substrate-binding domain-containing protein [Thauera sp. SDU_THAU2]|uniref:LysR substrate-binding domain-containing protein n=1 Tax=Thauera sp. SDU_THAU2 TaxID=3136633 RepID=UPI00311DED70